MNHDKPNRQDGCGIPGCIWCGSLSESAVTQSTTEEPMRITSNGVTVYGERTSTFRMYGGRMALVLRTVYRYELSAVLHALGQPMRLVGHETTVVTCRLDGEDLTAAMQQYLTDVRALQYSSERLDERLRLIRRKLREHQMGEAVMRAETRETRPSSAADDLFGPVDPPLRGQGWFWSSMAYDGVPLGRPGRKASPGSLYEKVNSATGDDLLDEPMDLPRYITLNGVVDDGLSLYQRPTTDAPGSSLTDLGGTPLTRLLDRFAKAGGEVFYAETNPDVTNDLHPGGLHRRPDKPTYGVDFHSDDRTT